MTQTRAAASPAAPAACWRTLGTPTVAARTAPSDRSFGLTVGGGLLAIAVFSVWRGHPLRAEIVGAIGGALVVTGVVAPRALGGLSRGWMRIGGAIGRFNSRVLLTAMFAVVFTPIGLIARAFGNDPLERRRPEGSRWSVYPERFRDSRHYDHLF
jgi:saxitoxin biosynthesis operon SxtJ-like protein